MPTITRGGLRRVHFGLGPYSRSKFIPTQVMRRIQKRKRLAPRKVLQHLVLGRNARVALKDIALNNMMGRFTAGILSRGLPRIYPFGRRIMLKEDKLRRSRLTSSGFRSAQSLHLMTHI